MLRLEGVSDAVADKFNEEMTRRTQAILEGRERYHPTANNCTTVSLDALAGLGFDLSAARYFTRRFPRPAFGHILNKLPRLVASGDLGVDRVELSFIPQVPVRPFDGGAPNRPLRDRARIN